MSDPYFYTSRLGAGLGLVPESGRLLDLWHPGMDAPSLLKVALESGTFPALSARRLRNMVVEAFAPRFLVEGGQPARLLKMVQGRLSTNDFRHLLFVYTCRANPVLGDFIREVYWERYAAGGRSVTKDDAHAFVSGAVFDGRTRTRWSDTTILRVSQYVLGACADFGLVGRMHAGGREILPFRITPVVSSFLAHDLHFRGLSDNAVLHHPDWTLFGLGPEDTLEEMKRLALTGQFILQSASGVVHISWKLKNPESLPDALATG